MEKIPKEKADSIFHRENSLVGVENKFSSHHKSVVKEINSQFKLPEKDSKKLRDILFRNIRKK